MSLLTLIVFFIVSSIQGHKYCLCGVQVLNQFPLFHVTQHLKIETHKNLFKSVSKSWLSKCKHSTKILNAIAVQLDYWLSSLDSLSILLRGNNSNNGASENSCTQENLKLNDVYICLLFLYLIFSTLIRYVSSNHTFTYI